MRNTSYNLNQRFIERFDLDLVTLNENIPSWFREHLTMLVRFAARRNHGFTRKFPPATAFPFQFSVAALVALTSRRSAAFGSLIGCFKAINRSAQCLQSVRLDFSVDEVFR